MELAGSPEDPCAGYMVEDSDLEYSDCSEGERSKTDFLYLMHTSCDCSQYTALAMKAAVYRTTRTGVLLSRNCPARMNLRGKWREKFNPP